MEDDSNTPPIKFINKVIFIFFGIASLLGWNALLTKLDFFQFFLSDIEPPRSFPFYNYFLNITFQFLLIWKKNLIPLKIELITGIVGTIIFLVLVPLSASTLGQNEMINKIITSGLIVLMGFTNALASGGFFSYVGYFPLKMIVLFNVGQGISAIALNILEYIVIAAVKIDEEKKQFEVRGWIFFGFGILILIICLILLLYSYTDEFCKYYLNKGDNKSLITKTKDDKAYSLLADEDSNNEAKEETEKIEEIKNIDEDEDIEEKFTPTFSYIFKKSWDLYILVCYIYIITFALFPTVSVDQKIFEIDEYNSVTIITIYNTFDTLGRYIVNLLKPNKTLNLIFVLGRSILLITLILNDYSQYALHVNLSFTSIFLIVNVAILGITNGISATLTFGLASSSAEDEIKKQTGGFIGFFCILGIFLGSITAFGTGAIIDTFKKS